MVVPFNQIPGNVRVPLFYAEFNPGSAPYQSISRLLLIGQKLSGGSAVADTPIQVTQNETGLAGAGSMLEAMHKIARKNAPFQEIWWLPLADSGSTKATGTITVGGAPASSGQVAVYIAGKRVRFSVTTSDTANTVATALAAAINAGASDGSSLPVTAVAASAVVTLTARHAGTLGNFIRVEKDYYGDEGPLATALLTIVAMASGATDPDITAKLANLSDMQFDFIAMPYTDTTNLGAMQAFLNDVAGRWGPLQQLYGGCFAAKDDTQANLATFGLTRNDQHMSVMGYSKSPSPPWEWAAAYAAVAAAHLQDAPEVSRPLQSLEMVGLKPPKSIADRFSVVQRQALYYDGVASYFVRQDNTICIDRAITTYQTNVWGSPDPSWLDVETLYQGVYGIRFLKQKVTSTWGRAALRDDNPQGIIGVATPSNVRDTIVHGYKQLSDLNVFEHRQLFEAALVVERNQVDANRLDIFLPLDHVNQLRIIAVNATSYLELANAL